MRIDGRGSSRLGALRDILVEGEGLELPSPVPTRAAKLDGKSTGKMSANLGARFLANVIPNLAVQGDAGVSGATQVQFTFGGVSIRSLDPAKLGKILVKTSIDFSNPVLEDFFADKSDLAVVTEVLLATSINISWFGARAATAKAIAKAEKVSTEVGLKASAFSQSALTVSFDGQDPLVFALKVFSLELSDGVLNFRPKNDVKAYSADDGGDDGKLFPGLRRGELLDLAP